MDPTWQRQNYSGKLDLLEVVDFFLFKAIFSISHIFFSQKFYCNCTSSHEIRLIQQKQNRVYRLHCLYVVRIMKCEDNSNLCIKRDFFLPVWSLQLEPKLLKKLYMPHYRVLHLTVLLCNDSLSTLKVTEECEVLFDRPTLIYSYKID